MSGVTVISGNGISEERKSRISLLQNKLSEEQIERAFLFSPESIHFFTGFSSPALSITPSTIKILSSPPLNSFIDPHLHLIQQISQLISSSSSSKKIGFEGCIQFLYLSSLTFSEEEETANPLSSKQFDWIKINNLITPISIPKTPLQVNLLKRAVEDGVDAIQTAFDSFSSPSPSPSPSSCPLVSIWTRDEIIERETKSESFQKQSGIGRGYLREGELVLLEVQTTFEGEEAFICRSGFVSEEVPQSIQQAEKIVQGALNSMLKLVKEGREEAEIRHAGLAALQSLDSDWTPSRSPSLSQLLVSSTKQLSLRQISCLSPPQSPSSPLLLSSSLLLTCYIQNPKYGILGLSDLVIVTPSGSESLLPKRNFSSNVTPITANRQAHKAAQQVKNFFGEAAAPTKLRIVSQNEKKGENGSKGNLDLGYCVMVKDEFGRLGQKAFKALGAGYSVAQALLEARSEEGKTFAEMCAEADAQRAKKEYRIVTASDGNHGASVAWAANCFGAKGVVYLPKGAAQDRVDRIASFNSDCFVTDLPYDDVVRLATEKSEKEGWLLVQDTAWVGYTDIPRKIMDGYCLIAQEVLQQTKEAGKIPTHIFLQVGVGSFASAMIQYIREELGAGPKIISVEPKGSACMYWSIVNGVKTDVVDSPPTYCVGLDCGEVSELAWPLMRDQLFASIAFEDRVAARGLQALAKVGVACGESGAATSVGILLAFGDKERKALGIDENSNVLVFNTEGVTDSVINEKILASDPPPLEEGDILLYVASH